MADHHAARDAGAERIHPHLTLVGAQALLQRLEYSGHTLDGVMVDVRLDDLRNVAPLLRDYVAAADRGPPAPRPEPSSGRAQVLDRYMSLHGATLADRREAERYLAYVLDGPDREGVPPLRGSGAPTPGVEAMLAEMIDRVDEAIEGEFDGLAATKDQAREVLAYTLTGLPPGPERDATLSAALARLTTPADPAPAALAGAVRVAAQAVVTEAKNHGRMAFVPWPTLLALDAVLSAESAAGDGWERITGDTPLVDGEPWIVGREGADAVGEARWRGSDTGCAWWWAGESEGDYYAEPISPPPTHRRPLPAPPRDGGRP